uniref:Uncharacterized protein n=1 Tax=Anguilla anguilla TaxID=7936 RepID=A0A0E9XF40_ANGAN
MFICTGRQRVRLTLKSPHRKIPIEERAFPSSWKLRTFR